METLNELKIDYQTLSENLLFSRSAVPVCALICLFVLFVADVRAASAVFLFLSYCLYYLSTVSVLGK